MYEITQGSSAERAAVKEWLFGLDLVSEEVREKIVTAWVSVWTSSRYPTIESIPYSVAVPPYGLKRHVNEVTRVGLELAAKATQMWDYAFDLETLVPILILHDVDKPLIYQGQGAETGYSQLGLEIPHGVVGGMLLRELGFAHVVVATVTTHAANAPFHGRNPEAYVLHYADMFSTDNIYIGAGLEPFYQQHLTV
jgi:hypothetical protein